MKTKSKFNSKLAPDMGFEFRLEHGFYIFYISNTGYNGRFIKNFTIFKEEN